MVLSLYDGIRTDGLVFLEGLAGQAKGMFGAFDTISCGNSLDGFDGDVGFLNGPGEFPGGSFNVRLQFRA